MAQKANGDGRLRAAMARNLKQCWRKRRARVVLSVFLGVVTTLFVAWSPFGLSLSLPGASWKRYVAPRSEGCWLINEANFGSYSLLDYTLMENSPASSMLQLLKDDETTLRTDLPEPPRISLSVLECRGGWPCRAMSGWRIGEDYLGLLVDPSSGGCIPIHPLWRGMLVDWTVHSIAWYAAMSVLWNVVVLVCCVTPRSIRRRRGRCVHCGYDLRGLRAGEGGRVVCPECGR